jgi:hypothetical protein
VSTSGEKIEGTVESTSFTDDGQTLVIDGKSVELDAVTGVIGGPNDSQVAQALTDLGPSLSANLAPELIKALQGLGLTVASPSGDSETTVSGVEEG